MLFNNVIKYDKYAIAQKYTANILANKAISLIHKNIIEIGCGTGLLTQQIINNLSFDNITIIEQSKSMIEICKKKINLPINYIHKDVQDIDISKIRHDLIISNMCLHWVDNIEDIIKQSNTILFSVPTINSFQNWRNIHKELDITCNLHNLISLESIYKYPNLKNIEVIKVPINFDNILSFIKHFKYIDAYSFKNQYSYIDLKKLINYSQQKFYTEYEIAIILCQK